MENFAYNKEISIEGPETDKDYYGCYYGEIKGDTNIQVFGGSIEDCVKMAVSKISKLYGLETNSINLTVTHNKK